MTVYPIFAPMYTNFHNPQLFETWSFLLTLPRPKGRGFTAVVINLVLLKFLGHPYY